jgi:predicted GNAT family N-acyltransferase
MDIRIKQPETDEEFKDYYHLRWKLLRAPWNQPQGTETDDIEDQCFHIMALTMNEDEKDKVIGVARLQFNSETEAQIRYMAIAREYERKGIGRKIMNTMEKHAGSSMCKNIVLDARQPAVDFYKKLGYKVVKKSYLLFGEIQHFRMKKEL